MDFPFISSCWLMLACLTAQPALAAPVAAPQMPGCLNKTGVTPPVAEASSNIDYPTLNSVLTSPDRDLRLRELPVAMTHLDQQGSAEATAVNAHLRLALAEAQTAAGQNENAITTLKGLSLDSARAPDALLLLAELEVKNGRPEAARKWLRQLAELFPDDELAITALLRSAALSDKKSAQLGFLQEASNLADTGLDQARRWQQHSEEPDFLDAVDTQKLPPALWRLARNTLTDPDFTKADEKQAEARLQLRCLLEQQDAHFQLMQKNPLLLADLASTVTSLDQQLMLARQDLASRERAFMESAAAWKTCHSTSADCSALQAERDAQGRALTGWRNRIATLETKRNFLRQEKSSLPARWQQDRIDSADLAGKLISRRSESRIVMQTLLRQALANSLQQWETIAAEAHYRLALAQDPRTGRSLQ